MICRRIILLQVVGFILMLTSCSSIYEDKKSEAYKPPAERKLQKLSVDSKPPHASELDGHAMNVIWNIQADVSDELALSRELKEGIVHQLKTQGIKIKGAQDKKTQHLIEEIERARRNSSELNYLGEQKVDYYVKAAITRSAIKTDYSKPIWCPMCKKKRKGSCEYDLHAGLQLEVLSLPSLRRMKHDSVKTDESFSVDVFDQCQQYDATPEANNEYQELQAEMIETLIECTSYSLNNFLAPEAYIEKYFSDGKKHIYQLSAGRTAGIKRGDDVSIFRVQSTGKTKLGEAEVIAVKTTKAFIQIKDDTLRENVRMYDRAKVQYGSMLKNMACANTVTKN